MYEQQENENTKRVLETVGGGGNYDCRVYRAVYRFIGG